MNNNEIIAKAVEIQKAQRFRGSNIGIVDFSRPANEHRLFIVDVKKQEIIYSHWTTHGQGSGPLAKAVRFSNTPNSRMSSLGLMKCSEIYNGKYGKSLRLDGLEPENSNVRKRAIVMHPSSYVTSEYVAQNKYPGRSHGCICLDPKMASNIIDLLVGGSYLYVHADV